MDGNELLTAYAAGRREFADEALENAVFPSADLACINLSGATLQFSNLFHANLSDAHLSYTNLESANLAFANLRGAVLCSASLQNANLRGADLFGACLLSAELEGTNLRGAKNILVIGPGGSRGDLVYAVQHEKAVMLKTGCFWDSLAEFVAAVKRKPRSTGRTYYERVVIPAVRGWGNFNGSLDCRRAKHVVE